MAENNEGQPSDAPDEILEPAPPLTRKTASVARLDVNGVFLGVDEIDAADLTDQHIPVPTDCDLEPGRYQWDAEHAMFLPIAGKEIVDRTAPLAWKAMYLLVRDLQRQSFTVNAYTAEWAEWFAKTIEAH